MPHGYRNSGSIHGPPRPSWPATHWHVAQELHRVEVVGPAWITSNSSSLLVEQRSTRPPPPPSPFPPGFNGSDARSVEGPPQRRAAQGRPPRPLRGRQHERGVALVCRSGVRGARAGPGRGPLPLRAGFSFRRVDGPSGTIHRFRVLKRRARGALPRLVRRPLARVASRRPIRRRRPRAVPEPPHRGALLHTVLRDNRGTGIARALRTLHAEQIISTCIVCSRVSLQLNIRSAPRTTVVLVGSSASKSS
ncbi:hypothetical protein SETIT_3G253900v2 [Setaria italica]|uniref:Uncharacterized protein n=1 Tax=Setaria italica TaxID=4555 RepID=A0A368QKR2_SETIT|nr:hypothetical protein SETIT_3G253900v2 [Setaria italica]